MKASQPLCHPHTQGSCPTPRSTPGPATGPTLVPTETPPQGDRTDLVTPALAGRGWNKHSALTRASARPPPLCQALGGPMHTGGRAEGSQAVHTGLGDGGTARAAGQTRHPPCREHEQQQGFQELPSCRSLCTDREVALQLVSSAYHSTLSRRTCSSLQ